MHKKQFATHLQLGENGRWREAEIEEQISLILVRHANRRRTKRESAHSTGCIREDCADMQVLEQKMNQQVLEQNERLKSLELLITEYQKGTENRMDQTEEAIRLKQQVQQRTEMMFQQFLARAQEETSGK